MKINVQRISTFALIGLLFVNLAGCGSSSHDTPEAVFKAARDAGEKKDFKEFCVCMTTESQDVMAGMMAMGGVMMKAMSGMAAGFGGLAQDEEAKKKMEEMNKSLASIDALLKKHGIDEAAVEKMGMMQSAPDDPIAVMKKLVEPVKDKTAFISEMAAIMESMSDGRSGGQKPSDMFKGELVEVKTDGDRATAVLVQTRNGKEDRNEVIFKKENGGWLIDLVAVMENDAKKRKEMRAAMPAGGPAGFQNAPPVQNADPAGANK